ncbi:MAG: polysaccharide deacetylase family protein [Aeromicrobium sp.]|nr:polysaccharide deacetylase family protein [Burkholderiales bacterium]
MLISRLIAAIASPSRSKPLCVVRVGLACVYLGTSCVVSGAAAQPAPGCKATVYLTIDTGHMGPAEEMARILKKHNVNATFFLANEKTQRGDTSLDPAWTNFWKARADEGHAFGTHTWRHWYFRGDVGADKVRYTPWGQNTGEELNSEQVCQELRKSDDAFKAMTGRAMDPIWRAPGGKLTPNARKFAAACGYQHVAWSTAGFSGDELPSEKYPSDTLISNQLKNIRDGDILLWHLGIWSRKDALYLKLDNLIVGLKEKGYCFARITDLPAYQKARR